MRIVRGIDEMKEISLDFLHSGMSIGFVPTMGALHEGHLSLLRCAKECADISIMSIFVNPTQFAANEDLSRYPRPFERDCELAQAGGCDIMFSPEPDAMYPQLFKTFVQVEDLGATLCGISRPTHFKGVTTVVLKLFNIVMPTVAVFGQKDAQQAIVLKRMVRDLNMSVEMVVAPIVRESDGLAMSSRNVYLTPEERAEANIICEGLNAADASFDKGERSTANLRGIVEVAYGRAHSFTPEYIEIVDTSDLKPVATIEHPALLAVAVRTSQSRTKLIDNCVLGGSL